MTGVAILLVAATIAFAASRALRLPLLPLLLLAGIILRYSGLALSEEIARSSLEMGLAILVFGAGMELNPKRFGGQYRRVLGMGLAQFLVIGAGGALLCRVMGLDWISALYVGLAVTTSSTLIVVRLLKTRQQMFEPFGRVVTGVLLVQDLIIVLLIVLLIRLPDGPMAMAAGLGGLAILGALVWAGLRWVMPYLVFRLNLDQESLGLAIMAVLFIFMWIAYALNLPIITGAFLAGVSLSAFPINSVARGLISSVTIFFLALFFVILGGIIDIASLHVWLLAGVLSAFIILVTPVIVTVVGERLGLTARAAIESGLLLAQTSEFSLVVVLLGMMTGQIPPAVFHTVALATVLTMTVTPLIATDRLTWRLMRIHPRTTPRDLPDSLPPRDHVVLIGYGRGGEIIVKAMRDAGREIVVIDYDPVTVRKLNEQGIRAVHGEGSDRRLLEQVNARRARAIISSMRRVADTESMIRHLGADGPLMITRIFEPNDAERIRRLGGIPVLSSEAAADAFLRWYQYMFGGADAGGGGDSKQ